MNKETYGTIVVDVSRVSKFDSDDLAILESYYEFNDYNIENLLSSFMKSLGLNVHRAEIKWDKFFNEG